MNRLASMLAVMMLSSLVGDISAAAAAPASGLPRVPEMRSLGWPKLHDLFMTVPETVPGFTLVQGFPKTSTISERQFAELVNRLNNPRPKDAPPKEEVLPLVFAQPLGFMNGAQPPRIRSMGYAVKDVGTHIFTMSLHPGDDRVMFMLASRTKSRAFLTRSSRLTLLAAIAWDPAWAPNERPPSRTDALEAERHFQIELAFRASYADKSISGKV